jgi:hypothetical protein
MTKRMIHPLLFVIAVAMLAVAVPAAHADQTAQLSIEDNNVLFDNQVDAFQTVPEWKALGVDTVRLVARWNRIAPKVLSTVKPAGFNSADPNAKGYNWKELDFAIGILTRYGIAPTILIPDSGPVWDSEMPSRHDPTYKPKATEFSNFAQAVVKRYRFKGVKRYLLGNEPNQTFFLKPQLECIGKVCTDFSPSRYRDMLNATYPVVKRLEPGAQFLIGELAPIGSTVRNPKSSLKPLAFLRGLACVDKNFKPITAKANPHCKNFKAPKGDGFSFHPYQVKQPPAAKQSDPDLVKLGDLPKLFATLDKLTAKGRLHSTTGKFNLYLTEFGYETNPPDKKFGVSEDLQSKYLQQGAYIAWETPRVKLFSQYVWRDERNVDGFQSGLVFANNKPKKSLLTFPNPFFFDESKGLFWGQVRPGGANNVQIIEQAVPGGPFLKVGGTIHTTSLGYFTKSLTPDAGATYEYQYLLGGKVFTSGGVKT